MGREEPLPLLISMAFPGDENFMLLVKLSDFLRTELPRLVFLRRAMGGKPEFVEARLSISGVGMTCLLLIP